MKDVNDQIIVLEQELNQLSKEIDEEEKKLNNKKSLLKCLENQIKILRRYFCQ